MAKWNGNESAYAVASMLALPFSLFKRTKMIMKMRCEELRRNGKKQNGVKYTVNKVRRISLRGKSGDTPSRVVMENDGERAKQQQQLNRKCRPHKMNNEYLCSLTEHSI